MNLPVNLTEYIYNKRQEKYNNIIILGRILSFLCV